jgi:hypothetical protein
MKRKKRTLNAGLILLVTAWVFIGVSPVHGQSVQTLDFSDRIVRDQVRSSGFIATAPVPSLGSLQGSRDERGNLSETDLVYIKLEPGQMVKPGDRYYLARWGEEVAHPVTKQKMGNIVRVAGMVVILDGKGQVVPARIEKSFFQVRYGDLIIPPGPDLPTSIALRLPADIQGIVVASSEGEENITQQVAVYIDRGSRAGVITGDLFSIYQLPYYTKEAKQGDPNLPLLRVGEGVAILVNAETSTIMITESVEAVHVGDIVIGGRTR